MQAAFEYLAARKECETVPLGAIGWCMGGGLALQLAIYQPHLGAVVVNYGALPTDPNDIQQIGAWVLGNFGADDKGITPADVQAFEKTMKGLNRRVDVKIYPGAGHAFENPNNTTGYRPEAAAGTPWKRTLAFLTTRWKSLATALIRRDGGTRSAHAPVGKSALEPNARVESSNSKEQPADCGNRKERRKKMKNKTTNQKEPTGQPSWRKVRARPADPAPARQGNSALRKNRQIADRPR